MSATRLLRDETVHTGQDSAARLVMADSTNLSLGPNATLKLDRTVFNDDHSYREIAIPPDRRRVPLRHRTFGKSCLYDHHVGCDHRRARHRARYSFAAWQDHGGAAGRRLAGMHAPAASASELDAAWRHRDHHLERRARPGSTRPAIRPGRSRRSAARRRGFAAPRNMPMRRPPLRRRSMTAAIPTGMLCGR